MNKKKLKRREEKEKEKIKKLYKKGSNEKKLGRSDAPVLYFDTKISPEGLAKLPWWQGLSYFRSSVVQWKERSPRRGRLKFEPEGKHFISGKSFTQAAQVR
jgi:hypothetical protein